MSAYATPAPEASGRFDQLLPIVDRLDPAPRLRGCSGDDAAVPGVLGHRDSSTAPGVETLLDLLVQRIADAVAARLAAESTDQDDEWLDSRAAAEYLGVHRDTLRKLAAERAIPAEQDGRGCKLYFRRVALDEWRRSGGRAAHLASKFAHAA
jgi:excisionase family DNA binding protein